jgi:putative nucleotidyltransferase with HDIG domain
MISPNPLVNSPAGEVRRELGDRIERNALELRVLSHAAAQVASLSADGKSDARTLADKINHDPALAFHVLRVANSALYAPVEPIVSLQQAVSRLGFAHIGQIAFSIAVKSRVFQVPGHEAWVAQMWQLATLGGAWAREVARVRRHNAEAAFMCGLLHDIGRPVLLQAAVDASKKRVLERADLEAILDELHTLAGAKLARAWNMAPWMQAAILHHHDVSYAGEHADECLTTSFVDELAGWTLEHGDEAPADALARLHSSHHVKALGLYDGDLVALLGHAQAVKAFAGALQ